MVNAQDYYHSFIKMYDENVGEHCAICRQKDWLAIRCKYCSAPFCHDHFKPQQHECPKYSYDNEKKVYIPPENGQKLDYLCVTCRAKLTPINFFYCKECNLYYCLNHRMHEDHTIHDKRQKQKDKSFCVLM